MSHRSIAIASLFVCFLFLGVLRGRAAAEGGANPPAAPAAEAAKGAAAKPGHSMHGEAFDEGPRQRAYLMGGTGEVHFPVTTRVPLAQQFFNQGVGQLHGFWYFEAERSFRQVLALDRDCVMAYWGMAMANTNNDKRAKSLIAKAVEHKASVSAREAAWIEALFPRYLLVRLSAMHDNWGPIRSTTGVCNFVRFGEYFARLPDDLVDFLRSTQEMHGPRVIKPVRLAVGDRIRITDGVASGYEGIIVARTARDRVRLLLNTAAGYSAPVDVREQSIESPQHAAAGTRLAPELGEPPGLFILHLAEQRIDLGIFGGVEKIARVVQVRHDAAVEALAAQL